MTFKHKLSCRLALLKDRGLITAIAVLAAAAVVNCERPLSTTDPITSVARVVISPNSVTLQPNESADFTAASFTAAGDSSPVGVLWHASSGVISDTGTTGHRHYGRYKNASCGDYLLIASNSPGWRSDTAKIAVRCPVAVASVAVSPASAALQVSQTVQLAATPQDTSGNPLAGRVVTWASSNIAVAPVTASGLVTAVAVGSATITATSEGKTGTAAVAVAIVPVASVAVTPASATLQAGQTVQLAATPKDANGNALSGRVIGWSSSNPSVATVNASGLVTGVAAGSATITAVSEGKSGGAAITVNPAPVPVASVAVTPASATVQAGQTVQLAATPKDANGNPLSGRVVTWVSGNSAVATVNAGGLVTSAAAGSATITATSEGQSGTATITVTTVPVASVAVTPAATSLPTGGTVQLTAIPKDANGTPLTGRSVAWTSSNGAVATVSSSGLVTAVATGSATITATSEGQSGSASITVSNAPVATVAVTPASASVQVGQTVPLTATPKDASGTPLSGRVISWSSSNTAVATVSSSGVVSGVAAGVATITATSEGQSGSSSITVSNVPVASVAVSPASASVQVGQTVQLTATPKDANGNPLSGRTISWSSSNTATASVNSTGLVTAVATGAATITATSEAQSGTSAITVVHVPVASVAVTPASASVSTGQTVQLTATPKDASGNALAGRTVSWASSNTAVETVTNSGLVSGVTAGAATITATSETVSGTSASPTAALLDNIPGTVFTAGDNAYPNGSSSDYSQCYNPSWGRHKARTRPSPGNHDHNTSGAAGYFGYFGAQAGPSGLGYYSYDLGAWHIISLDSNIDMSAGSAQETWLRADLAASTKRCAIAYWHHPRFSSGTNHGSEPATQPLWQALYDFGAEIVISGHDHEYERFAPQTPNGSADPARGIREFVVGTGGAGLYSLGC